MTPLRRSTEATTERIEGLDGIDAEESDAVGFRLVHGPTLLVDDERDCFVPVARAEAVSIGRDSANGIALDDPRVSRVHARVVYNPLLGQHCLADASSANGTFVNGSRADGNALRFGDVVRLGDSLLVWERAQRAGPHPERLRRAAVSNLPLLLLGETGTGKEVLARKLHEQSRREGPLVVVDCGSLSRELAASELFGHARNAFSGAASAREGLFRTAQGGSLFLDEIGDLPFELQPALLRVLQERSVRPVGSDREIDVDVRVIAATHVDLERAVCAGSFREDLFARLAHVVFELAPLRERRSEILSLVREFQPGLELSASAAEVLLLSDWSRNVRELRATVEALSRVECTDGRVGVRDLKARLPAAVERVLLRLSEEHAEESREWNPRERAVALLRSHRGNVTRVAQDLGKPRSQVYRWLQTLGLSPGRFRNEEEER